MTDLGKQLADLRERLTSDEERYQMDMELRGAERGIDRYRKTLMTTDGHGGPQRRLTHGHRARTTHIF